VKEHTDLCVMVNLLSINSYMLLYSLSLRRCGLCLRGQMIMSDTFLTPSLLQSRLVVVAVNGESVILNFLCTSYYLIIINIYICVYENTVVIQKSHSHEEIGLTDTDVIC
jgi:hypothetical protein